MIGALVDNLWLSTETDVKGIVALLDEVDPDLLIVDSSRRCTTPSSAPPPGTVTQVRGCAQVLIEATKRRQTATLLVGHVTKENDIAGPRVLEHAVDTVLSFGGDRHHALRLLRALKHRFGSTDELGLFEMGEQGLIGVPDPSALFLADRRSGVAGSIVVPTVEGHRPLLVEVQALVASAGPGGPRRSVQGVDASRLSFLVAVLEQRVDIRLAGLDIYVSVVGGVRVTEPGSDLAIALAIVSAVSGHASADRSRRSAVRSVSPARSDKSRRHRGEWPRRAGSGSNSCVVPQSAPASVDGDGAGARRVGRRRARPRRSRPQCSPPW